VIAIVVRLACHSCGREVNGVTSGPPDTIRHPELVHLEERGWQMHTATVTVGEEPTEYVRTARCPRHREPYGQDFPCRAESVERGADPLERRALVAT
jgi:hypothetical protein